MATRKYSNRLLYRPRHKKMRLRKNVKGFRCDEFYNKRCKAIGEGYYYPSKYLAER